MQSRESYVELIRSLPAPTLRQTTLFASYVASAHSWYKHLPVHAKVPFYLYLDPHSGEFLSWESKGRKFFRAIGNPAAGHPHYSGQSTEDYRRKFGCWSYAKDCNTFLRYDGCEEWVEKADFSLTIVDTDGCDFDSVGQIPYIGRAALSAIIHPEPQLGYWDYELGGNWKKGQPFTGRLLLKLLEHCEELSPHSGDPPVLPTGLAEAIASRQDKYSYGWKMESFLDQILSESNTPGSDREELFPKLVEFFECKRTEEEIFRMPMAEHSPVLDTLLPLLLRERLRQLRAMKNAMIRVLTIVYG